MELETSFVHFSVAHGVLRSVEHNDDKWNLQKYFRSQTWLPHLLVVVLVHDRCRPFTLKYTAVFFSVFGLFPSVVGCWNFTTFSCQLNALSWRVFFYLFRQESLFCMDVKCLFVL